MDRDRLADSLTGSLLNKAYEIHCMRDREFRMMDMMNNMDIRQEGHMSNEDRLFMTTARPQSAPAGGSMSVVGGRLVNHKAYPVNGQQLQLQLDQLTSAMTDMIVTEEQMETHVNPAYAQYMEDRVNTEVSAANPFCQEEKRRDPVYLSSMAAHTTHQPVPAAHNDNKQEFFAAFLQQNEISEQMYIEQEQYYLQLIEQHYAHHLLHVEQQRRDYWQQQQQEMWYEQQQQTMLEIQAVVLPATGYCGLPSHGGSRLLKRTDLLPVQKCTMWS